jgi:hypothetical protein
VPFALLLRLGQALFFFCDEEKVRQCLLTQAMSETLIQLWVGGVFSTSFRQNLQEK